MDKPVFLIDAQINHLKIFHHFGFANICPEQGVDTGGVVRHRLFLSLLRINVHASADYRPGPQLLN